MMTNIESNIVKEIFTESTDKEPLLIRLFDRYTKDPLDKWEEIISFEEYSFSTGGFQFITSGGCYVVGEIENVTFFIERKDFRFSEYKVIRIFFEEPCYKITGKYL